MSTPSVAFLEKVIESPNLYQFDSRLVVFLRFDSQHKAVRTTLRRPNKYNRPFEMKFLNELTNSITQDQGDGDEVRKFNINQVVNFVQEKSQWGQGENWDASVLLEEGFSAKTGKQRVSARTLQATSMLHDKYNLLYLIIGAKNEGILKDFLKSYGYKPFFYKKEYDPFMAAFETRHFQTLDVISDYLGKEENKHLLSTFYDHLKFCVVMKTSHPKLQKLMMGNMFLESSASDDDLQQMLSSKIDQFPLRDGEDACLIGCFSSALDRVTKQEIFEMVSEGVRSSAQFSQVKILTTKIKFSFNIKHSSCRNILKIARKMQDEDLSGDFKYVIAYIWEQNMHGWVTVFLLLEFLCLVSFNVFLILYPDSVVWMLLSFYFCIFMSLFEMLKNINDVFEKAMEFDLLWILDFVLYPAMSLVSFLIYAGLFNLDSPRQNFLASSLILLSGLKSIDLLSLFDETRYLNAMILSVLKDIVGFTILTILFIIIFVLSGLNSYRQIADKSFSGANLKGLLDARTEVTYYYNVMFGNWEDNEDINAWNGYRYVLYLVCSFFLAFIMANLVIAMISKTFDTFQDDRELFDTKGIIDLLLEHSRVLGHFESKGGQKLSESDRKAMRHLCIIKRVEDDSKETKDIVDKALEPVKNEIEAVKTTVNSIEITLSQVMDALNELRGKKEAGLGEDGSRLISQMNFGESSQQDHLDGNIPTTGGNQLEQRLRMMCNLLDRKIHRLEAPRLPGHSEGELRSSNFDAAENSQVVEDDQNDMPNIKIKGLSGPSNGDFRLSKAADLNSDRQPNSGKAGLARMNPELNADFNESFSGGQDQHDEAELEEFLMQELDELESFEDNDEDSSIEDF